MFNKVVMAVIAATATNAISLNKAPVPNQSPAENAMAPYAAPAGESAMTFPGQTPSLKVHKLFIKHFMEHAGAIKALVMKFPDFAKMAKEASPELVKPFMVNPRMALKKFIRKHPKATSEFFATHGDEIKAFCGASEQNGAACGALKKFYDETIKDMPAQNKAPKVHKLFIKHFMEHASAIKAIVNKFPVFAKMMKAASPGLVKPFMANPRKALEKFLRKHPKATGKFFAKHGDKVKAFCGASEQNSAACHVLKNFYDETVQDMKVNKDIKDFVNDHAGAIEAAKEQFSKFMKEMEAAYPEQIKAFMANPRKALKALVKNDPNAIKNFMAAHKDAIDSFCGANEQNSAACHALKNFYKNTIE